MHKLKKKIERQQSQLMKVKIENKNYSTQIDTMKQKLSIFEAKESANMTEERKQFINWKVFQKCNMGSFAFVFEKAETRKIKKLQRELDSKAKLILNAPSKQLRRDIQQLNGMIIFTRIMIFLFKNNTIRKYQK